MAGDDRGGPYLSIPEEHLLPGDRGHQTPAVEMGAIEPRGLAAVVEELCSADGAAQIHRRTCDKPLPSRADIIDQVEALRSVLFPGLYGNSDLTCDNLEFHVGATLDRVRAALQEQIQRCLCFLCEDDHQCDVCHVDARNMTMRFLDTLPAIQEALRQDVQAAYEGDPAARNLDEAALCYPGILAMTNYRIAHELHRLGVPLMPRIITEHAHTLTGIDIHPGARIGRRFFMDHGTGIVIGETTIIGDDVRVYQGVTLGAKSFFVDDQGKLVKGIARHPIVEDRVVIYSGATILGRVTIGEESVIGGNVWLTRSVPPRSKVTQALAREETFAQGSGI